ncbi:MAG: sugar phosphate isomerase/epimerase family protein [Gemmataceae bacterium]
MTDRIPRRDFLAGAAAMAAATATAADRPGPAKTPNGFKKAVKFYMVQDPKARTVLDKFQLLRDLGFDGVELDAPSGLDRKEVLAARDRTGLAIPGVVDSAHWGDTLSHPDPKVRARGVRALEQALDDAHAYGATTVLLVPAVVNKEVAYDHAWQRSAAEIRKVLPRCERLGVKIALENVWNNFLLSPLETARYVDEFRSEHIGVHFDVGNVVVYSWPEQWIRILGKRILKLDIKEFSRKICDQEGRPKGFNVPLLKGDCDWPAVMKALKEIGYVGWGAAEIAAGNRDYLTGVARDMNTIFAY